MREGKTMATETKVTVDSEGIVSMRRGDREVQGLRPYRGCQVAAVLSAQEVASTDAVHHDDKE